MLFTSNNKNFTRRSDERPGFSSFKTKAPLHFTKRWHRSVFIYATLDPSVTLLAPSPVPLSELPSAVAAACLVVYRGSSVILGLADAAIDLAPATVRDWQFAALARHQALGDQALANACAIWECRRLRVAPADRFRVLQRLRDNPVGISIQDLANVVRSQRGAEAELLLSMACAGLVSIELSRPLTPETVVKRLERPFPDAPASS